MTVIRDADTYLINQQTTNAISWQQRLLGLDFNQVQTFRFPPHVSHPQVLPSAAAFG